MKNIFVLFLLLPSMQANATLIDSDYLTVGDGLITIDTETGLEWLDLTASTNLSYNYVSSQLGSDGQFKGWAYASRSQVANFFESTGAVAPFNGWTDTGSLEMRDLIRMWGVTGLADTNHFYMGDVRSVDHAQQWTGYTRWAGGSSYQLDLYAYRDPSSSDATIGSALVRNIMSVPEPSSIMLMGLGLVGLGFLRRKNLT